MVVAAVLGIALGVVTGMPLGVINVAIVDAAVAGRHRFALGLGCGGALADAIHAGLAFGGTGRLVTSHPALVRVLAIAAAILIVTYAIVAWRHRASPTRALGSHGFATGLSLTLPNPGALTAWVAVAAALWPDATLATAIAIAVGVGVGSAAWFAGLSHIVGRMPREHRALQIIPRAALVVFVGIAVFGVVRALS